MAQDDQEWAIVRRELSKREWDFRTIDGLSKATGLSSDRVADLIDRHAGEVRISNLPDKNGRPLYTLAERPMKFQEILANTVAFITRTAS
jgi:hypothetical protein